MPRRGKASNGHSRKTDTVSLDVFIELIAINNLSKSYAMTKLSQKSVPTAYTEASWQH
jgi:hypothetical protein